MRRIKLRPLDRFINRRLEFHVRVFNALALMGVLVSLLASAVSYLVGNPVAETVLYIVFCLLSGGLLWFSTKTGRYKLCYIVTIVVIFLIGFPVFFLIGGGNYGAMPYFFIFAIVFTVVMLDGRAAFWMPALELVLYSGLCVYAHFFLRPLPRYYASASIMLETLFGILVVGVALAVTTYIQIRLNNGQRRLLAKRNAELDRLNRNKTEFLGNVSHELKTPLTVISGYAQECRANLAGHGESDELDRSLKLISSEADRLALMVSQMLDVTRIEEGRMLFDLKPARLSQIIQSTLQTYYPMFGKNNNTLELERGSDSPIVICDSQKIGQVLVNLISNASRHTHNGKISIGVRETEGFAEVTISDNGEGIPADSLPGLFERYKVSGGKKDARAGRDSGTGLGLYICRHIISEHGGQISLESKLGKGTSVRFTIPVKS